MIRGFKEFLLKNNVLALAIAVIVGGAVVVNRGELVPNATPGRAVRR